MKKILLLSDTHGLNDERILHYASKADEVWHAGDIGSITVTDELEKITKVRAVFGNIDGQEIRKIWPEHNQFLCEEVSVWITHIGGYPGNYNKEIRELLKQNLPNLFICGHSHILKVMNDKKLNLLHMNPGAAGKSGFHQVRTMLRFEINGKKIEKLEVIELGKRG
jgi:uncharacterized protein